MKKLLSLLLMLLPLCALGQSKESNELYNKGVVLFDDEKYEEAIPFFQKCDSLDKAQLAPSSENYYRAELKIADCWEGLAVDKYYDGDYTESIRLGNIVMETRKKILGEEHHDYATALSDLALYYNINGNYAEAIRLGTIAMNIDKQNSGEDNPDYAMSLGNVAYYNSEIGNYTEAIKLATLALGIRKKQCGNIRRHQISLYGRRLAEPKRQSTRYRLYILRHRLPRHAAHQRKPSRWRYGLSRRHKSRIRSRRQPSALGRIRRGSHL